MRRERLARRVRLLLGVAMVASLVYRLLLMFR
jgi:hypothetical protein